MHMIQDEQELAALYDAPGRNSTVKEAVRLTPEYRRLIAASPFFALATSGPEGLDCSPRGDRGTAIHIEDDATLMIPDRRGNNRIDSLRNIVRDPRVALLFLIPGSGTTVRVNGRAGITADPDLLDRFAVEGKRPRSVAVITIERVYFQCARAVLRAGLWDEAARVDPKAIPSPGELLQAMSAAPHLSEADTGEAPVDAAAYDADWQVRAPKSLW